MKMKKLLMIALAGIFLLNINSCVRDTEGYNIKDALKISAYLFDENSGEDYYIYDDWGNLKHNDDENIFKLEQLQMNEVRIMSPMSLFALSLNIRFEFDGIIEIISENNDVQMYVNHQYITEPITRIDSHNHASYSFEMKFPFEGFIAATPLGSIYGSVWGEGGVSRLRHYVGREYYLNVNAYKFDNEQSPIIRAQLRLVQLEDKADVFGSSACFSIELISYEYSDMYKIMYEIDDD